MDEVVCKHGWSRRFCEPCSSANLIAQLKGPGDMGMLATTPEQVPDDLISRLRDADTTRRIGESYADTHERRQRDRNEAAAEIERLRAALEEVRVLVFGANRSEARYPLARAALTKGERTPSFGDFVEGCDYLPVPSTKGESYD